jgi:hypothetical protein
MLPADDTVLAIVPLDCISDVLTAAHRGGFGHLVKVFDARRSPVNGQLARAGILAPADFVVLPDCLTVAIAAPARTARALELFELHGATAVWITSRKAQAAPAWSKTRPARALRPIQIPIEAATVE